MLEKLIDNAMKMLLDGDNEVLMNLSNQYASSEITLIEDTGVGMFVAYNLLNKEKKLKSKSIKSDFVFGDVFGTIDNIFGAVGFIVFVENGCLKTLEIYSAGHAFWKKVTDDLVISYDANPRNIENLEKTWLK